MAPKPRVGLEKWWKAWFPVNGMIQRQLSPFEVKVVGSLARNWQSKTIHRVRGVPTELCPLFEAWLSLSRDKCARILIRLLLCQ
jgi:hypothetical protein